MTTQVTARPTTRGDRVRDGGVRDAATRGGDPRDDVALAPLPAGTRPSRPGDRRGPSRPGGRRGAPALPPVRPGVAGRAGTEVDGRPGPAAPVAVVHRRRRAVAVAVLAVLLGAVLVVGVTVISPEAASPSAAVPAGSTVTVVGDGESLTDIARRTVPDSDAYAVANRIRELNGLASSAVPAGRPVLVPAP